jgi:hypothetical protein
MRIQNGAERHKPRAHGRRLDEEQDHQLGVFGFAEGGEHQADKKESRLVASRDSTGKWVGLVISQL